MCQVMGLLMDSHTLNHSQYRGFVGWSCKFYNPQECVKAFTNKHTT